MNSLFSCHPYKIYENWRLLRQELKLKENEEEILNKISDFWWDFPFVAYFTDFENPKNWPNPWEIIYEKKCDELGRSLLMSETILLLEKEIFSVENINIKIYKDRKNYKIVTVLFVNNFVLNFEFKKIVKREEFQKYENEFFLMYSFKRNQKGWYKEF